MRILCWLLRERMFGGATALCPNLSIDYAVKSASSVQCTWHLLCHEKCLKCALHIALVALQKLEQCLSIAQTHFFKLLCSLLQIIALTVFVLHLIRCPIFLLCRLHVSIAENQPVPLVKHFLIFFLMLLLTILLLRHLIHLLVLAVLCFLLRQITLLTLLSFTKDWIILLHPHLGILETQHAELLNRLLLRLFF